MNIIGALMEVQVRPIFTFLSFLLFCIPPMIRLLGVIRHPHYYRLLERVATKALTHSLFSHWPIEAVHEMLYFCRLMSRVSAESCFPGIVTDDGQVFPSQIPISRSRIYLNGFVHDVRVRALVDSGSSTHFISETLAIQVGVFHLAHRVSPVRVQTVLKGHTVQTSLAVMLPLEVRGLNSLLLIPTYIVRDFHDELILGLPFVTKYYNLIPWYRTKLRRRCHRRLSYGGLDFRVQDNGKHHCSGPKRERLKSRRSSEKPAPPPSSPTSNPIPVFNGYADYMYLDRFVSQEIF